jgi:hypothetical protein
VSDRKFITLDEAIAMLPEGKTIHCFKSPGMNMLVGADWDREEVLKHLKAGKPELAGPIAVSMGHGLACGLAFFETKKGTK